MSVIDGDSCSLTRSLAVCVSVIDGSPCLSNSRWTCVVATDCYHPGVNTRMLEIKRRLTKVLSTRNAVKYIDYHVLTSLRYPENVEEAHSDTFIQVWMLTILANTVGDPAVLDSAGCKHEILTAPSCHLNTLNSNCPNCRCPWGEHESGWLCANMRPCAFSRGIVIEKANDDLAGLHSFYRM